MLSWEPKEWWHYLENTTWTARTCDLWLPKIRLRYLLLRRVLAFDKGTTFQSHQNRMSRSDGLMSNLQHGVCERRLRIAWMFEGQVYEEIENASIWSSRISSWALNETKKTERRIRILRKIRMRWEIQGEQPVQSRLRDDNTKLKLEASIRTLLEMLDGGACIWRQLHLFVLQWLLLWILPRICQVLRSCRVGIYHFEWKCFETLVR